MCEQYLLSIESTHFHPAKLDRFWSVNKKCLFRRDGRRNEATNDGQFLYCLSFLIGYLDNGVSQRRTAITKGRPTDATTRRCGYINCWERQLLSRRLLEGLYARMELSNSSKEWTARTASRSIRTPLIISHKLLKAFLSKTFQKIFVYRTYENLRYKGLYVLFYLSLSIYYICINFCGQLKLSIMSQFYLFIARKF